MSSKRVVKTRSNWRLVSFLGVLVRTLALLLALSPEAGAIESIFEGNTSTSLGAISSAQQPAGLAWLSQKISFAASASSFGRTNFEVQDSSYESAESPLSIKPVYVATGKGFSWGGMVLAIANQTSDVRTNLETQTGANLTRSDLRLQTTDVETQFATGMKLGRYWALGWSLFYGQSLSEQAAVTSTTAAADKTLEYKDSQLKTENLKVSMGSILSIDGFRLGLKLTPPQYFLSKKGYQRTRTLSVSSNLLSDTSADLTSETSPQSQFEVGVRMGEIGSAVFLSDNYSTQGSHNTTAGYEYRGKWGLWATSLAYQNFKGVSKAVLTGGLLSRSENYDWGLGPQYSLERSNNAGAVNSRSWSVLYASEIRY